MLRAREPTSPGGFRWLRIEPVVTVVSVVRSSSQLPIRLFSSFAMHGLSSRLKTDLSGAGELRVA